MKNRNKGGRPRKMVSEKKTYIVSLKMSTEEYYTLKGKASEAKTSMSEIIRQSIASSKIIQRLTPELNDYIRKLCGMANNLNQIAKNANAGGYRNARTEYLYLAGKIDNIINKIK